MAKQILVVEDEKSILHLMKINLEMVGYEVRTASNGREALEAVPAQHPDLIVMDIMMPEMDGIEALRNLKSDEATSSIPVIMLTSKSEDADVFRGWQSGADAYLTKPFDLRELLTFIRRIFEAASETASHEKVYEIPEDV